MAATGWGALFVITPLTVTHFLFWITGSRTTDHGTEDTPDWDDYPDRDWFCAAPQPRRVVRAERGAE
ncbi:hypothetical protein GCM10009831_30930 [Dietzia cercidiphylli]|uniref:Uncharacterized protein n=1 Tax=Dietzia cercidiphylli TaxID=498199 RepID=A0ABN2J612_9ACTN